MSRDAFANLLYSCCTRLSKAKADLQVIQACEVNISGLAVTQNARPPVASQGTNATPKWAARSLSF